PGAELFDAPFPKIEKASKIPSPGPGFDSSRKRTDFPASFACSTPIGPRTPWLIALFKNRILAGSIIILVKGSNPAFIITSTPAASAELTLSTPGPMSLTEKPASIADKIQDEKLL